MGTVGNQMLLLSHPEQVPVPDGSPSPLSHDKPDPAQGSVNLTLLSSHDAVQVNKGLGYL